MSCSHKRLTTVTNYSRDKAHRLVQVRLPEKGVELPLSLLSSAEPEVKATGTPFLVLEDL